jgi:hypothetical protein
VTSRFLFNEALWGELLERVPSARRIDAAVAYFGDDGARLLPLRSGDRLVVDMSIRSVRAGSTNPYEIRKLLKRGVEVFSRGSLHAKYFIIDNTLIAGSSNISKHAREVLDEAAVLTTDAAAVVRARAIFARLCTEPVRKDYLAKCIEEYRPPKLQGGNRSEKTRRQKRVGKVWIIGGLRYIDPPESEQAAVTQVLAKVEKQRRDYERSTVDFNHSTGKHRYFEMLREGDWLISCVRNGSGFEVCPPARFLGIESYPREGGKRRYLVVYEIPTAGKNTRWAELRRNAPSTLAAVQRPKPRTMPVASDAEADSLLRLWTPLGTFKRSKR